MSLNSKQIHLLLLGFSSGLPLALVGGTLQGWLTTVGVDVVIIGLMSMVGQPYVYKFLWAPLLDHYTLPWLGRRRGWIITMQIALLISLLIMAQINPLAHPGWMAWYALGVAVLSATQDIAIDAYRTDSLAEKERGIGTAMFTFGYRIALLVSGGLAFVIADQWGWPLTYHYLALLMLVGIVTTVWSKEPPTPEMTIKSEKLLTAMQAPFQALWQKKKIVNFIAFVVIYKLGDAVAGSLTITFLLRELDFSLTSVGMITKTVGFIATLIGVFLGGSLLNYLGLFRALLGFGLLQGLSNLTFMALALIGKNYPLMILAVGLENMCAGMGTAALLTLLMALCDQCYSASQYALLSAFSAVGRVFVGSIAGIMVKILGWSSFFGATSLIAVPGIILLYSLRDEIKKYAF